MSLRRPDIGWRTMLIIAAILVANVVGSIRWYRKRNPAYALEQTAESVRHHDASQFDAWVDVDKLAASYYDQHLLPARLRDKTFDERGRSRDIAAIARRLRRWVVTGRIDEEETPRLTLLGKTLQGAITGRTAHVDRLSKGGRTVIASVTLDDGVGHRTTLDIRLDRQRGGGWRITEVTNVEGIVDELRRSEMQRVRAIEERLAQAVVTSKPRLAGERVDVDQVTREFEVVVTPRAPTPLVEWSAVCDSDSGTTTSSGQVLRFPKATRTSVRVRCRCNVTRPCRDPIVRIDAVTMANARTLRRETPLPLD
ncbi:MAG TPA: hypothetical protein VM733_11575 [Thermoanaerobaculia bacterium]|nr:hypothetical protein [Thermoanaerobaculia bacterium]